MNSRAFEQVTKLFLQVSKSGYILFVLSKLVFKAQYFLTYQYKA